MQVTIFPKCSLWYAQVELTLTQWPPLGNDVWLERPIYKWVTEQCDQNNFFSNKGHIMFAHEDDLVKFLLTWS